MAASSCSPSPVDIVLGRRRRETKGKRRAPRVRNGTKYGYLTVNTKKSVRIAHARAYECKCECGGTVHLTSEDILRRRDMKVGCMSGLCSLTPLDIKIRFNPRYALELQLRELLKRSSMHVTNEWGGFAYPGVSVASIEEGVANMLTDVLDMVNEERGEWWMARANPILPYAAFNVVMLGDPQINVLGRQVAKHVRYGDRIYSVEEVAKMVDLPLSLVRKLRREIFSDEHLMKVLIKRGRL